MRESVHLGRVAGIRIGANWSLLVVFWLIAWMLAGTELPHGAPGRAVAAYWVAGVLTALVFYGCLLAHELAHAVVARRAGIEVEGIVLWLFGGVSQLKGEAATPETELRVAVAGPATSVALGLVFWALTTTVTALSGHGVAVAAMGWLGWMNVVLGVFNLAPAFPLDGGRVLRAWLWHRDGDKRRATESAASAGRGFGYVLIALGLLEFALGGGLGGLWLVFLGWFLLNAARAEAGVSALETDLAGIRAGDAMTADPISVPAAVSLQEILDRWMWHHRGSSFPVLAPDGTVVGLLTLRRIKTVPAAERGHVLAGQAATPLAEVAICDPGDPLMDVFRRMAASADHRALVFRSGRLVGILSPSDVTALLDRARMLRP